MFKEIIKESIGENKNIVISLRDDGRLSIAQQVLAESDGKKLEFFLKNAIIVDKEGLNVFINALEKAKRFLSNENVDNINQ